MKLLKMKVLYILATIVFVFGLFVFLFKLHNKNQNIVQVKKTQKIVFPSIFYIRTIQ